MSWQKKTLTTLLAAMLAVAFVFPAESYAASLVKRGSESGDVWDLQYRLQILGYYQDKLDGSFGANTAQAVRQFQKAYGLPADGIAGENTWQVAVAAVALNRLQSKDFPNTLKGVIFEPYAFTAVDDGQYWLSPNKTAYRAAWEAVRGWDPTNGALYYFNPATATSKWIWSRPQVVQIGKHIFAK